MNKYQEAIDILQRQFNDGSLTTKDIYEAVQIVDELVYKETPKKPDYEGDGYADGELVYDTWICPNCGKDYEVEYEEYERCPHCGQLIDWTPYEETQDE